jgi:hypothetical protein
MRLSILSISLCLIALAAPSHADTRTMSVGKFSAVSVSSMVDVELRQGPQSVTVEQDAGDFSDLRLEVRDGTLMIGRTDGKADRNSPDYRVVVTAPTFISIKAGSASEVEGRGLSFQKLAVSVAGAASVSLEGACKEIALSVSTSGDFDGDRMRCETGRAEATTGGEATIWISGPATARATTGANLTFFGKPKVVEGKATLGGSIHVK